LSVSQSEGKPPAQNAASPVRVILVCRTADRYAPALCQLTQSSFSCSASSTSSLFCFSKAFSSNSKSRTMNLRVSVGTFASKLESSRSHSLVLPALVRKLLLDLLKHRHALQHKLVIGREASAREPRNKWKRQQAYCVLRGTTILVNRSYLSSQSFARFLHVSYATGPQTAWLTLAQRPAASPRTPSSPPCPPCSPRPAGTAVTDCLCSSAHSCLAHLCRRLSPRDHLHPASHSLSLSPVRLTASSAAVESTTPSQAHTIAASASASTRSS